MLDLLEEAVRAGRGRDVLVVRERPYALTVYSRRSPLTVTM
jgi:hypothetical protein